MRFGDRDHFRCPDCSTLLHRKLFSSHPAECSNKTEQKHANKGGSYDTNADNVKSEEESAKLVLSFEINEFTLSHLDNSTKQWGLPKDTSVLDKFENPAINPNYVSSESIN